MNQSSLSQRLHARAEAACGADGPGRAREVLFPALLIDLPYRRIRATLWAGAIIMILLGAFREVALYFYSVPFHASRLIGLDIDRSLQEWWSVLQLMLAAILLFLNGKAEPNRRWRPYWFVLAAAFVFLSLDESAGIHEFVNQSMESYGFTGFFRFAWIIPYGIACLALGVIYLPFVLALPRDIALRIVFAGGIFVGAALVMEGVGGYLFSNKFRILYSLELLIEESGEIIGVLLFILALLALLRSRCKTVAATI